MTSEAIKYISEATMSNFSVFVRSVGTWFIVGTWQILELDSVETICQFPSSVCTVQCVM